MKLVKIALRINIVAKLLRFYGCVIVVLFELKLATECRHSVASCQFCSQLHVYTGSRCHLGEKHTWVYSTSCPHRLLPSMDIEQNSVHG